MNLKELQLALLTMFSAMAIGQRARILFEMKTIGLVAKALAVLAFSLFVTFALLHGLDLLPEFLSIFDIVLPL